MYTKRNMFWHPATFSMRNLTVFASVCSRYFTVGKLPVNLKLYITGKSFPIPGNYRKFYKMYSYEI